MNPEIKAKWVADLRSGKYPQTVGLLHRLKDVEFDASAKAGFCCLGVLCEQAVAAGVAEKRSAKEDRGAEYGTTATGYWSPSAPTSEILRWAGIGCPGESDGDTPIAVLIGLNDNDKKTFPEIADWIEANL